MDAAYRLLAHIDAMLRLFMVATLAHWLVGFVMKMHSFAV